MYNVIPRANSKQSIQRDILKTLDQSGILKKAKSNTQEGRKKKTGKQRTEGTNKQKNKMAELSLNLPVISLNVNSPNKTN